MWFTQTTAHLSVVSRTKRVTAWLRMTLGFEERNENALL